MMRTIERSTVFKRDYKRIKATPRYRKDLDSLLSDILKLLLSDKALPDKNLDHSLSGNYMHVTFAYFHYTLPLHKFIINGFKKMSGLYLVN